MDKRGPSKEETIAAKSAVETAYGLEPRDAVMLWPTPTSCDGAGGPGKAMTAQGSENLRTAVQWSTPMASDGRLMGGMNSSQQTLVSQVNKLRKQSGLALNPAWVESLMGFPDGWTDGLPRPENISMNGSNREQSQSAPIDPID
jgi:hypothetical protein